MHGLHFVQVGFLIALRGLKLHLEGYSPTKAELATKTFFPSSLCCFLWEEGLDGKNQDGREVGEKQLADCCTRSDLSRLMG